MYRVYQLTRRGYPTIRTIATAQAGGCTRNELDKECERVARGIASRLYGGYPLEWTCLSLLGQFTSLDGAQALAEHYAKDE